MFRRSQPLTEPTSELAPQPESAPKSAPEFFAEMLGDPMIAFGPSTGAGNLLCAKAEVDELKSLLIGPIPAASSVQPPSATPPIPRSAPPKPFGSDFKKFVRDTIYYATRAGEIAKGDARRQAEISRIRTQSQRNRLL